MKRLKKTELKEDIDFLKKMMVDRAKKNCSLLDESVQELSRQLDEKIVEYMSNGY